MTTNRAENHPTFRSAAALALLLVLSLATVPAAAQEAASATSAKSASDLASANPRNEQEIVAVEHADPEKLAQVLSIFPLRVEAHPDLGLITLRGARADLDAAIAAAHRLDVTREPSPSVRVMAHVLRASRTGAVAGSVPPSLEGVAKQLREVFGFQGVALVDTLVVQAADRAAGQVKGRFALAQDVPPIAYRFGFNRLSLLDRENGDAAREVRLDGLEFATDEAGGDVRLVTDLEVREGQQAVVGKASGGRAGDDNLIVVLEVKVLD